VLILSKQKKVQALDKIIIDNSWITLLLICLFICVFFLKGLSFVRLKGSVSTLINKSFIYTEVEEHDSFLNPFKNLIFIFSVLVFSLLIYKVYLYYNLNTAEGFFVFLKVFVIVFSYLTIKRFLEILFSIVFMIDKKLNFFLVSKSIYLYSVSFFLFIAIILEQYSPLETRFLVYFSVLLLVIRFVFHAVINKKLIFSELFYFILYLCAFEIAPLFILFRLLF